MDNKNINEPDEKEEILAEDPNASDEKEEIPAEDLNASDEKEEIPAEDLNARDEKEEIPAEDLSTGDDKGEANEPPDDVKAEAIIEAILFTMGDTVEISKLADAVGIDLRSVKKILKKMDEQYRRDNRGIMLTQFESAVQLCTKPEMYEYLIKIAKSPKKLVLTDTVIETLSIIAYKQPVTRLDVENIRGVNCDHAINKLLEYDLITELGRLDAPGRPILFGTTEQFLRCFGVKSLEELPELSTVQIAEFKAQAEAEVQLKLDI